MVRDGERTGVAIANSSALNLDIHPQRTISLWFQAQGELDGRQVIYEQGGISRGLNIYLDGGSLYAGAWNLPESNWEGTWLSTEGLVAGRWYHLALVLDGSDEVEPAAIAGYLDGEEFARGAVSQLWIHQDGIGLGNINGTTLFHDGTTARSRDLLGFDGLLDELKIYNRVLDEAAIAYFATAPTLAIDEGYYQMVASNALGGEILQLESGNAPWLTDTIDLGDDLLPLDEEKESSRRTPTRSLKRTDGLPPMDCCSQIASTRSCNRQAP